MPGRTARDDAAPQARIVADLSAKRLYLHEGRRLVASYPISDGKDGHATPRGEFRVRQLNWNPSWHPPKSRWARGKKPTPPGHPDNPMKVVKIFFRAPTFYIHGTSEVDRLGRSASHGCLRMDPDDIAKVGKWVMQHGGEPKGPSWFRQLRSSPNREQIVYLSDPVRIEITD